MVAPVFLNERGKPFAAKSRLDAGVVRNGHLMLGCWPACAPLRG